MSRPRTAFTLVEMLVVVAIIGVLIMLLLPAVQAAREAARRSDCGNKLSQLIIAVHNYEIAHSIFPPGTIDAKGPVLNARLGYHHNWVIQILPYVEERNAWNALDKQLSVYHARNKPIAALFLPVLFCPSSSAPRSDGLTYAGVHHNSEKPIDKSDSGVFFLNSVLRCDDITDGMSHTLLLGEKFPDAWELGWMSGTRASLRNAGTPLNALTYSNGLPRPTLSDYGELLTTPDEAADQEASSTDTELTIPFTPPAGFVPGPGGVLPGNPLYVGGFGSHHPRGAQFAMGDGSVRFIAETIAPNTYGEAANRHDGGLPKEL